MNRIGSRTLPWITPATTSNQSEYWLFDLTRWFLPVKYCAIHGVSPLSRSFSNLLSRIRSIRFIRSNVFLKSKKTACVVFPSAVALFHSSMTWISASIVLLPAKNPYCLLSFQNDSVCFRICLTIIRSNVLHRDDVGAIGL